MSTRPQDEPQEIDGKVSERTRDELLMWLAEGLTLPQASAMVLTRVEAEKGSVSIDQIPWLGDAAADESVLRIAAETPEEELSKLKGVPGALRAWGSIARSEGSPELNATRAAIELGRKASRANRFFVRLLLRGGTLLIMAAMPLAVWNMVQFMDPFYADRLARTFEGLYEVRGVESPGWLYSLQGVAEMYWPVLLAFYCGMIGVCVVGFVLVSFWSRRKSAEQAGAAEAVSLMLLELRRGDEFPAAATTVGTMLGEAHVASPLLTALETGDPSPFLGRGLLLAEGAELASAGATRDDVLRWLERRLVREAEEVDSRLDVYHQIFTLALLVLVLGFVVVLLGIVFSSWTSVFVTLPYVAGS